jgi:predicted GIY-YIG superfamily endonuclease
MGVLTMINLADLPSIPWEDRKSLPHIPAVYFVISKNSEVIYIGSTYDICNRLNNHNVKKGFKLYEVCTIRYITSEDKSLLIDTESKMIKHFKPVLNKRDNPNINDPLYDSAVEKKVTVFINDEDWGIFRQV